MVQTPSPLSSFKLLKEFSESELEQLKNVLEIQTYPTNHKICLEGDLSREIYFIISGSVEMIKEQTQQVVYTTKEGNSFGELSFLDNSPRSATVQTKTETQVYVLTEEKLLQQKDKATLLNKLYRNIAINNSDRLRETTTLYAQTLEKEIEFLQERNRFNHFLITVLMASASITIVDQFVQNFHNKRVVYTEIFAWIYMLVVISPMLYFVIQSKLPWSDFGLTWKNSKKSITEGLLICFVLISLILVCLELFVTSFSTKQTLKYLGWPTIIYFTHSFGQEFLARGVMQGTLIRFLGGKWKPILITSVIFGLTHSPYGPALILVTIFFSIPLGLFYLRHNNLLGVSLVHHIFGSFMFIIINIFSNAS